MCSSGRRAAGSSIRAPRWFVDDSAVIDPRSSRMAMFSSDPAVAKKQMLTVVFLLTAFGHMDGKFSLSEKRFVQEKIAKLVEERVLEAAMDPLARQVAI